LTSPTSAAADRLKDESFGVRIAPGDWEDHDVVLLSVALKIVEAQQTDTLSRKEWWGLHLQCVRCGEDVVKLYTGEGVKNWVALCVPCWGKVQNKILASMPKLDSAKAEGKE